MTRSRTEWEHLTITIDVDSEFLDETDSFDQIMHQVISTLVGLGYHQDAIERWMNQ